MRRFRGLPLLAAVLGAACVGPRGTRPSALRADPVYAEHLDLLDAALEALPRADATLRLVRHPGLEASARARTGRGTAFAAVTTWVEADGDARAIRDAHLDVGRVPAYTGRPGTTLLERRGDETYARSDGVRRFLGAQVGARWRFVARAVDRGAARGIVTRQVPHEETEGMIETRGLMLAVPGEGGVRVVEVSASVLDVTVPPMVEGLAAAAALREMRARAEGIRAHWREYAAR